MTPSWPDDPETVEVARANPDVLANKTVEQIADHTTEVIDALDRKPAVIGHSTGGLVAEMLAGRGLSAATVAIDPGLFRGLLPLPPPALKVVWPVPVNPRTDTARSHSRSTSSSTRGRTPLEEKEAKELYDTFQWPAPG